MLPTWVGSLNGISIGSAVLQDAQTSPTDRQTDRPRYFVSPANVAMQPDNNNQMIFMVLPLREFTRFIWWMQTKRQAAANHRPSQPTSTLSPTEKAATVCIHHRHLLLINPKADTYFTVPWRWKAELIWHCSKGVQPMPNAVYRSGCRDKHTCPRLDSNLCPLTPQSGMLPLDHCDLHLWTIKEGGV